MSIETSESTRRAIPKIAIVGAGPGGCMLARLLHMHSIPCTIFEGEESPNFRSQGGTLDLRNNTGLAAMKKAGLWDEFQTHARYDGESLLVTDKNLATWLRRSQGAPDAKQKLQEAPEIDRSDLRRILMESVPQDCIHWSMRLSGVEEESEKVHLHFVNGQVERGFDLVIGADGAFSKTRNVVTSEKPTYAGIGGFTMHVPNAQETARELYNFVNRGSVFAYSDGKSLSIQQLSSGGLWVMSCAQVPEDYTSSCGFDTTNLESVKAMLKKELSDWSPRLLQAIEKAQGAVVLRNLYMLPVGFTWEHKRGITLLGDAAHLMTPFAGIGVNTALYDAMLLTEEIASFVDSSDDKSLDEHVAAYEIKMLEKAHEAQILTQGCMNDMMFTAGAPRTTIHSWVLRHAKEETPIWAHSILGCGIRFGYWIYKRFV